MNVRQKITLLITAAGFLSSLVFSCIILWEMVEQPFRIIDSDLETYARQSLDRISKQDQVPDTSLLADTDNYWLRIYDRKKHKPIYQSHLAVLNDLTEPPTGSGAIVKVPLSDGKANASQAPKDNTSFRIRGFEIQEHDRTYRVYAGRPIKKLAEEISDVIISVISGLLFSLLLLIGISYFIAGLILKPVRTMNQQARDITETSLHHRIPTHAAPDEFNTLAQTLNQVFDRLENAFLKQKQLLADASHELKTPLTMMRLALEERDIHPDKEPDGLPAQPPERLTGQVLRMERLVKNLLDLSSMEIQSTLTYHPINLVVLITSLIEEYRFLAEPHHIRVDVRLPNQIITKGDANKLTRAFSNLLDNAIKYNMEGGRVEIIGELSHTGTIIRIGNTGSGVPEKDLNKVFEQFFRVEKSRSLQYGGSGLGLSIVKKIIELHAGSITFESTQDSWTCVTISLPIRT